MACYVDDIGCRVTTGKFFKSNLKKDMIMVVTATLKFKAEYLEEVEQRLLEMVNTVVANEKETLEYRLHKDTADPSVFYFYERYKDKAAFDFHSKTDYFQNLFSFLLPRLDGEPVLKTYSLISE
jgi:quinol monooxygenase YgiN